MSSLANLDHIGLLLERSSVVPCFEHITVLKSINSITFETLKFMSKYDHQEKRVLSQVTCFEACRPTC